MAKRIAVITARAGSTRIPNKNKKLFHGLPIVSYSLAVAKTLKDCGHLDSFVISTDDDEIRDIGWSFGAQYLERQPEFARNEVGTREVMAREIDRLGLKDDDQVCCIYPTAPMLIASEVAWAMELLALRPAYFVVSVGTEPLADAGQFYCSLAAHWKAEWLPMYGIRTAFYPLPTARVCDINTEQDWQKAEQMYAALNGVTT